MERFVNSHLILPNIGMDANVILPILQKPKTLVRSLSTALISWDNVFSDDENEDTNYNTKYILQMESVLKEWKNIYWYVCPQLQSSCCDIFYLILVFLKGIKKAIFSKRYGSL